MSDFPVPRRGEFVVLALDEGGRPIAHLYNGAPTIEETPIFSVSVAHSDLEHVLGRLLDALRKVR